MKPGIHPEYEKALITCACGRTTETRSTVGELHVEICSHCHPFFTGRQKLVDTAGRVERFMAKYGIEDEEEEAATGSPADEGRTGSAEEAQEPTAESAQVAEEAQKPAAEPAEATEESREPTAEAAEPSNEPAADEASESYATEPKSEQSES